MTKRTGMEGLSTLLLKAYPGKSKEELEAVRAFGTWTRALSPRIVQNARPVKLFRGVLTVHTVTSAWANSLQLESESLIALMRRKAPDVRVKKLMFRVGSLPDVAPSAGPLPEPVPVTPAEHLPEDVARELARIHDDALREAVAKAAATGLGERPERKQSGQRDPLARPKAR